MAAPPQPAAAAGRCTTTGGGVEQRVAAFWQCVGSLGASDLLTAEDLGQWARNVIERAPAAGIRLRDFRASTAGMQDALERASAGVPPAPPQGPGVEERIALFWQKVDALDPCDVLSAADLGQWALNVIDRDPSKRITVADFRVSTAGMQTGLDRAAGRCSQAGTPGAACPGASGPYAICGRVVRADGGAPVAGAKVLAAVPHDPDAVATATTGADGRYTVTVPKAHDVYLVSVTVDPQAGVGPLHYGGVTCSWDAAEVRARGHVAGVDVFLRSGHWVSGSVRDSAGALVNAVPVFMRYIPSEDRWCDLAWPLGYSFDAAGNWRQFVTEGVYRALLDPFQHGLENVHPRAWYPSAPTVTTAGDIVVDRDIDGVDIVIPRGYTISGTVRPAFQDAFFWVQVVTIDGGRIAVVNEDYLDFDTGGYAFVVAAGSYKVRITDEAEETGMYFYARNGATTYEAGATIVVTNANVTGVDIVR